MTDTSLPSLLDEFAAGADVARSNPSLVRLANAKWQGALISAISERSEQGLNIEQLGDQMRGLARELLTTLQCDPEDERLQNSAMQAIIGPVTRELRSKGTLDGQWLDSYARTITQLPAMFRVTSNPTTASTSMGMTLANHYADLINLTNDFAFLREPADIAAWAHKQIDPCAHRMAKAIAPHDDIGPAYQNQLNVHRKLFVGAYHAEARQWKSMLDESPDAARLYPDGLPLSGVEKRFSEQAQLLSQLVHPEQRKTQQLGVSR